MFCFLLLTLRALAIEPSYVPSVDRAVAVGENASQAREIRHERMRRLQEGLEGEPEGEPRREMILRLADLNYWEGRFFHVQETDDDHILSRPWLEGAVELYTALLERYPRFSKGAKAMFFAGMASKDLGRDGTPFFKLTTKMYPDSVYAPEAWIEIGDHAFDDDDQVFASLVAYRKATRDRSSERYGYAMYKLAWCYYRVGDFGKATQTLEYAAATDSPVAEAAKRDLAAMTTARINQ